jgi:hypothetical protein
MPVIITVLFFLAVALAGSFSNRSKAEAPVTEAPRETAQN